MERTKPPIKLQRADVLPDGTQRFQSQLYVGKITADFIMESDGVMKNYDYRKKGGLDFYPYNEPYIIVDKIISQEL